MKDNSMNNCTGCEACVNVCPQNALYMEADKVSGFLYPKTIHGLCNKCGLCKQICPVQNSNQKKMDQTRGFIAAYAAYSKSNRIRLESTSGGMFTVFSKHIFSIGGEVYGAGYDENMNVVHMCVSIMDNISRIQKSKYVQSKIGSVYVDVENFLKKKIPVLFVGTPCQVAGLYSYLTQDYQDLYTIEFICLGVNSPLAYKYWIEELERKYSAKINNIWFKYKEFGWRKSPLHTKIFFDNGDEELLTPENNYFMKGYLQGSFFVRPCCSSCQFIGERRYADIVFGDFWGADTSVELDYGTSVILINSKKGMELFEAIKKDITFYNISLASVFKNNPRMHTPVCISSENMSFFKDMHIRPFGDVVRTYIGEEDVMPDILTQIVDSGS